MKERKSMRGVSVDFGKLIAKNEKNITVGNTRSNARGDQLGRAGRVVKSADQIAREHYNRNNPNAVKQASIKLDDSPKTETTQEKPITDDWEEPVVEETTTEPEEAPVEEDEWVEDTDGNFVRKSEIEDDKSVSKSRKSKSK